MKRRGGFLAAALLAAAINLGVSVPASAAGTAPRAGATHVTNALPPAMKGGKGNNTSTSTPTKQSATSVASNVAAGTPAPNEQWTAQNPNPDADPIFGITCPSATECVAVGLDGLLVTTNSGSSWSTTPTGANLMNAVSCADADHCAAAGYGGVVFTTANASTTNTWAPTSLGTATIFYGISCPTTTFCAVVGQGGAIFSGAPPVAQTSPTTSDLFAVSCASSTMCVAVGANGTAATYNGISWSASGANTTNALFGVSCPMTTTTCEAVGQGGLAFLSTNGGSSWFSGSVGNGSISLTAVSCHSTAACFMTGTDGNVYVQPAVPADGNFKGHGYTGATGALFGISCFSDTVCYGAGENAIVVTTTNGGAGWTQQTGTGFSMYGASCPSTTVCYVVGFAGAISGTTNGGSTFTAETSGVTANLNGLACPATTTCYAVGDSTTILSTANSGGTWAAPTTKPGTMQGLSAVSCADATHCMAVGEVSGSAESTGTVNGTNWTGPGLISATSLSVTGVSCPSTTTCFATVNDTSSVAHPQVFVFNSGGGSWALSFDVTLDPDSGFQGGMTLNAINCPSANVCYAVGNEGLIVGTSDGGTNWRSENSPTSGNLTGISCASTAVCVASGQDSTVYETTNAGATWSAQYPAFPSQAAYNDIACASTSTCLAVGSGGVVATTTSAGAAWTKVRPTGFSGLLLGMSCFGPANCYAVSPLGDILATHDSGAHWSDHTLGTGETPLSISCPATNTCYASGWPGEIDKTTDGGTTWTAQANTWTGADRTLTGISCASPTSCVVAGTDGIAMSTSDGATWNVENPQNGGASLFGVSCFTTALCVAIGPAGTIYTRNAGAWTARSSGTTKSLHAVSCLTASSCYIVGAAGTILVSTNGGVSWTAQSSGTTSDLNNISCAQAGFCVAGGAFGTALVTVDGATWNPLSPLVINTIRAVQFPDLNHVWLAGDGGLILADTSIFPSCRSVAIAPSVTSPQPLGTPVTLNATSSGCADAGPQFRFWIRDTSGTWHIVQDFSSSNTYLWNTAAYPAGTYLIGVWVKDANSSFTYDAYAFGTFTLQEPPCTSVGVVPDVASPQNVGATVTFTAAAAACPKPEYQWWVRDTAGNWAIAVPFGPGGPMFAWNTSSLTEGTYQIGVWVKEAFSTASYEAFAFITYTLQVAGAHCSVPGLSPGATASPQPTGTTVTFTATAANCTSPLFRFWIRDLAGTWHIVQDFSATNTFMWTGAGPVPNTAAGTYLVGIWAKALGSTNTYDDFFFLTYTLTTSMNPKCSLNVSPGTPSGATAGTTVTWTAAPSSACNATGATYRWFVAPPGGNFAMVRDYTTDPTFMWTQSVPGTYQVGAWILQQGSTAVYDAFAFTTFTLTNPSPPSPCTFVNVAPAPASPQQSGTPITLTATAGGCPSPQYQWWVRDVNANWNIAVPFASGTNTFNWNTTGLPAGTYLLGVWVKNSGSTASYEAYSFITFTLTPNPAPQVCTSVNIAPDLASPQAPGATVTFTATANGCNAAQYEFFVEPPGGSFAVAQGWSSMNTFAWNTSGLGPGPWAIGVWARQAGSTATYESFAFITYQLAQG